MIALGEDGSRALCEGIEASGDAYAEALHAAGELRCAVGLDEGVNVVGLNGPVDDTKARSLAGGDGGSADDLGTPLGAEADELGTYLERDVGGGAAGDLGSLAMEDALAAALGRLAPGPRSSSPHPDRLLRAA